MNRFLILFPFAILAADTVDLGVITDRKGIAIHKCHPGDASLIEVLTVNSSTPRDSGSFSTTNTMLLLRDLSMIPTGTNIFSVRTLCAGSTSDVRHVRFVIRRPIPTPIVVMAERFPVMPPLPTGMTMPLPGGVPYTYTDWRQKR